jgi:arylsulfatase A-like enzyme
MISNLRIATTLGVTAISHLIYSQQTTPQRPNIVYIMCDDHAYQAISAYDGPLKDYAPTPNIDRIAANGMRFNRCLVTNSITGPCRTVVLTGKYSHLNGFVANERQPDFDGSQQTFPKLLQAAGYNTADQGFYLGEHGWFDKRWMFEESYRAPLLILWPGIIRPGSVNNDMV